MQYTGVQRFCPLFMIGDGPAPPQERLQRFLIFLNWPIPFWMTEMFVACPGIPYVTIQAGMSVDQRTNAARSFTSAESTCAVLITSVACGSLGLNLHHQCS